MCVQISQQRILVEGKLYWKCNKGDLHLVFPPSAAKQKLRCERWRSGEAREEIHFFIEGTQTYVAGFNPEYFREDDMKMVLRMQGFDI